jgi:hypothetical protein
LQQVPEALGRLHPHALWNLPAAWSHACPVAPAHHANPAATKVIDDSTSVVPLYVAEPSVKHGFIACPLSPARVVTGQRSVVGSSRRIFAPQWAGDVSWPAPRGGAAATESARDLSQPITSRSPSNRRGSGSGTFQSTQIPCRECRRYAPPGSPDAPSQLPVNAGPGRAARPPRLCCPRINPPTQRRHEYWRPSRSHLTRGMQVWGRPVRAW